MKEALGRLKLRYPPGDPALSMAQGDMTELAAGLGCAGRLPAKVRRALRHCGELCSTATTRPSTIMRRILQGMGAEWLHPSRAQPLSRRSRHNAALQEDVQGIAISSYQGGHVEYFKGMIDLLKETQVAPTCASFGGGGGVIVATRDRRVAGLWRRAHLQPRGRPAHGPGGDDRRDDDAQATSTWIAARADGAGAHPRGREAGGGGGRSPS